MAMIKAIQTEYNGIKFRSRLEARWAVFFDTANIRYEYEPEGYETEEGQRYLPDYYLPDFDLYVEVKRDTEEGIREIVEKCEPAIQWGGAIKQILILSDIPKGESVDGGIWHFPIMFWCADYVAWGWWFFHDDGVGGKISRHSFSYFPARYYVLEKKQSLQAVSDSELRECGIFRCVKKVHEIEKILGCSETYFTMEDLIHFQEQQNKKTFKAFETARKARFEFGETPTKEE
jgi:hypothetical protein